MGRSCSSTSLAVMMVLARLLLLCAAAVHCHAERTRGLTSLLQGVESAGTETVVPEGGNVIEARGTTLIGLHHRPRSAESYARLAEWIGNTHKNAVVPDFVQDPATNKLVSETTLKNTDMVEYFGQVSVGGQNFAVVYDTGSGILWVPGAGCHLTACTTHEQLKTNKDITLETEKVDIKYGTGHMSGQRAVGDVAVGGVTVKNQDFLVSTAEYGAVFDSGRFDGVFGLGKSKLAQILRTDDDSEDRAMPFYINAIKQNLLQKPIFSFYISPGTKPGAVVIGGTNAKLYKGPIKYHEGQSHTYWMMNVESIAAGTDPADEVDTSGAEDGLQGIADTGTSLLVIPEKFIGKILHKFQVKDDCSNMDELSDLRIKMKDVTGELITYTLTPQEYILKYGSSCKTGIALMTLKLPGKHPAMIMGDTFLRSYYSVYNHENGQIGFADANHDHGEKIPVLVEDK